MKKETKTVGKNLEKFTSHYILQLVAKRNKMTVEQLIAHVEKTDKIKPDTSDNPEAVNSYIFQIMCEGY